MVGLPFWLDSVTWLVVWTFGTETSVRKYLSTLAQPRNPLLETLPTAPLATAGPPTVDTLWSVPPVQE